jgi:4-amino-4-deoxy-L-arabinose transferase-like glycosyltransferase
VTRLARSGWRDGAIVLALIFAWLAATAWARPLMLPDEGRYVGVAWEMLRSGEWLTPTLNGLPYFHKPPLFYWITAASMGLFGANEWAARAAPILGASLGAFSLYLFMRRWYDPRAARVTLGTLLMQTMFFIGGQFANLDMLVAGCISATILALAHAVLCVERGLPHRRVLLAAYAMAALGVLAKGLIGAVIPALVVLVWLALLRRWRVALALISWQGIAVFLLLCAPWFAAMQWRFDNFLDYFFVVQHFKRYAAGGFNNVHPFWFYPVVLLLFSLPWLPWLYRPFTPGYLKDPEHGSIRTLMLVWIAAVVLFFSLPASKLVGYVLPVLPPLAFVMAEGFLAYAQPSTRTRRLWWTSAGVAMLASLIGVVVLTVQPVHSARELAMALGAQRAPHEPVFMLKGYYFDLPFYARLRDPVAVVENWSDHDALSRDNWRKELADAGRFDAASAEALLIDQQALPVAICRSRVSWVVGPSQVDAAYPFLDRARAVASQLGNTLWRVDTAESGTADALGCVQRPHDDVAATSTSPTPRAAWQADARSAVHSIKATVNRWLH